MVELRWRVRGGEGEIMEEVRLRGGWKPSLEYV
jgi:hypothetical protein